MKTFQGRVLIAGTAKGNCVTRKSGLNALDTFLSDQRDIAGKILCLSAVIGSTTGGMVLQRTIQNSTAPQALLFSKPIDPLSAAGITLAQVWDQKELIAIDQLGDEFLEYVEDGMEVQVYPDGRIDVH